MLAAQRAMRVMAQVCALLPQYRFCIFGFQNRCQMLCMCLRDLRALAQPLHTLAGLPAPTTSKQVATAHAMLVGVVGLMATSHRLACTSLFPNAFSPSAPRHPSLLWLCCPTSFAVPTAPHSTCTSPECARPQHTVSFATCALKLLAGIPPASVGTGLAGMGGTSTGAGGPAVVVSTPGGEVIRPRKEDIVSATTPVGCPKHLSRMAWQRVIFSGQSPR
jgi:hypothetical protein